MQILVRSGSDKQFIEAQEGDTVLDALKKNSIVIDAPCGGAGKCMKCNVLVRDETGVSYRLACQTDVTPATEVTLNKQRAMDVSLGGISRAWPVEEGAGGYGIAIDVGTTTVAVRLYNLSTNEPLGMVGTANPQLVFGADVISRIAACEAGHLSAMAKLLNESLCSMCADLARDAGIDLADIKSIVLAGNTVMQHIAASMSPVSIGAAPFTPLSLFGDYVDYLLCGSGEVAAGEAYFAPCVAGYVGGDITCGLLAIDIYHASRPVLFMDLGTNGELALGDSSGIITCATAAGPVFEGANIKHGMPAYPGAICDVDFEDGKIVTRTIGDEEVAGICGTGLIDAVALMVTHGVVDETGRILDVDEIDKEKSQGLEHYVVEDDGGLALSVGDGIVVTQKDVRMLQLAKAALAAGILCMLDEKGLTFDDVDKLYIAGGFGQHLDLDAAALIGLIPAAVRDRAESVGNTAIEGAAAVLISSEAEDELAHITELCNYIELSGDLRFNDLYVSSMTF